MDCLLPGRDVRSITAGLCGTEYFHSHLFFQVDCLSSCQRKKHLYIYFCQLPQDCLAHIHTHRKIAWRDVYEWRLLVLTSRFALLGLDYNDELLVCLALPGTSADKSICYLQGSENDRVSGTRALVLNKPRPFCLGY